MNQNIWGPYAWFFLHTITFNYPEKPKECDKKKYKRFFTALKDVIPCKTCRNNYEIHLREYPIKLNTQQDLVKWLIDVHNSVNGKTGKRQYSYNEVIKYYADKLGHTFPFNGDTDNDTCSNVFGIPITIPIPMTIPSISILLFITLILCLLIVFLFRYYRLKL